MRKFIRVLSVFVFILCIGLFCGCSSLSLEKMRISDFGVALPKGTKLVYEYDKTDGGGGGEGNVYYVNKIPEAESFVSGIESSVQTKEELVLLFENFLKYFGNEIETEYLPDLNGEILWAVRTRSFSERDKVLLVFSYKTGLVYVGIVLR